MSDFNNTIINNQEATTISSILSSIFSIMATIFANYPNIIVFRILFHLSVSSNNGLGEHFVFMEDFCMDSDESMSSYILLCSHFL